MFNTGDFSSFLYDNGATMVGFADLSKVVTNELKYGVSIAIKIPPKTSHIILPIIFITVVLYDQR